MPVSSGHSTLQAAIAACHARARTPEETDWTRITALYDALAQVTPSPVVDLNRAVAVTMVYGPAAGLEIVDALASERSLKGYHLLPSVRGDFLTKLGRGDEALTSLSVPRHSRATPESASCCWSVPLGAPMRIDAASSGRRFAL